MFRIVRCVACYLVASLAWLHANAQTQHAVDLLPLADRRADFTTFVQQFEDRYAYLDQPEKPWLTWRARYAAAVDEAETRGAFDTVFANALAELHDFHAEVRSPVPDRWLPVPTFADIWAEFHGGNAVVTAVRHGSDAERAPIHCGDRIVRVGSLTLKQAVADRLTPAVDQRNARALHWALLSVLTGRADEGRTFTVRSPSGAERTLTLPVERQFDRPSEAVTASTLPGNIGLVRVNNSLGQQSTVSSFDAALVTLRGTAGLVLDLRDVPSGGDSSVALGIMGRFVTTMLPYQRHRIPNYGQNDVERNWIEQVAPRGPFSYTGPVVVLVGHWTGSMGEGIAIGFDAMHRATVVGTRMAGLAGAVSDLVLPKTSTDLAFATEQLFHVNGTPRQDWIPPVLVGNGDDAAVMQRGLAELKHNATP